MIGQLAELADGARDLLVEVANFANRRHGDQRDADRDDDGRGHEHDRGRAAAVQPVRRFSRLDDGVERERDERRDRERRTTCVGSDRTNHTAIANSATAIASGIAERGSRSMPPPGGTSIDAVEGPVGRDATSLSYEPMVEKARTLRVRLSVRSALAMVFALGFVVLVLEIAQDAERVIAWALSAMAVAALVYPAVKWLAHFRFVPRRSPF